MMRFYITRLDTVIGRELRTRFFAIHGGRVIGFVDLTHRGVAEAYFLALFVEGAFRRRGVGRALLDACIAQATMSACHMICCNVGRDNAAAIDFYVRFGFVNSGELVDDSGWMLERELAPSSPMVMALGMTGRAL